MPVSKRSHEGYLLVDNSAGPGVSADMLAELERRAGKRATVTAVGEGQKTEVPVLTCPHCQKQMVVNLMRTRERAWCRKCDHYICDECDLIRKLGDDSCKHRFLERAAERAARGLPIEQRGIILP
jgi:hypothetical protein